MNDHEIGISKFELGMAVEVMFLTPDKGQPALDLMDERNNVLLHVNPSWDQNTFILNTCNNGQWGEKECPRGFDFSSGVPVTIIAEARNDCFAILVNGRLVHYYKHRLPFTNICKARFYMMGNPGTPIKETRLLCLNTYF